MSIEGSFNGPQLDPGLGFTFDPATGAHNPIIGFVPPAQIDPTAPATISTAEYNILRDTVNSVHSLENFQVHTTNSLASLSQFQANTTAALEVLHTTESNRYQQYAAPDQRDTCDISATNTATPSPSYRRFIFERQISHVSLLSNFDFYFSQTP
jgi:hypothetical protein